ncbi:multinuclear nonheme iron-dependent oxidase [Streptomyces sp. NPDC001606]
MRALGTGIGWRPEIAEAVERMPGIDWVEVVAENVCPGHLPESLLRLRERGVTVIPHGVSLGLGGADRPDPDRLTALAERAEALGAPLVTEHIAFVRAGGPRTASPLLEAGHLLPVPRTRDALDVLCENVRIAQEALPVPLALENIAALFGWPGEELTEGRFLSELVERTGVRLLIDVANLHTNRVNRGEDPAEALAALPLEALAYVHVAGGFERDGVWHDSHAHPVPRPVLDLLTDLSTRVAPPGVLLERDENFPEPAELEAELTAIRAAVAVGRGRGAARGPADDGAVGRARGTGRGTADAGATERARGTGRGAADAGAAGGRTAAGGGGVAVLAPATAGVEVREATRQRLGVAQAAVLSALVAGTPVPEGFDRVRMGVQARALAAKRADVVAKVAPELPRILGAGYRPAFLEYARERPMSGGYRRDALDFAAHVLRSGAPLPGGADAALREWWLDRAGPAPRPHGRRARIARAARRVLPGRR